MIERLEFQRGGVWYARYFKGLVTFLVGHSKSEKSTAIEVLLYPLGLTTATVMPEVRSCQYIRLVFRVFSVKSSVLRRAARRRTWREPVCNPPAILWWRSRGCTRALVSRVWVAAALAGSL
ncbi:predicted protein [Streptomyces iranensis]|uniref:Uncharacterized protein n=1 Tax=Streptomyces iranensis TaxID=576784 RepID=A0A060ZLG6_9ACTN|nr:predicted protein [Streptomyces iranensis]